MPTVTIDLPNSLNVPANWDVQTFVLEKMYEAGFLASDQVIQTIPESVKDYVPANRESESWFTPQEHAQFRENRRRLEEELENSQTDKEQEELYKLLLAGPVADEETIKRQDEIREHIRQWKLPW
jgi:U3 small nucleolar RNA-associated protein 14